MQNAVISCPLVRNALQWINELGVLMNRSGKYKAMFQAICVSNETESPHPSAIKPLCPTRWLCRLSAIQSALDNYSTILLSLKEMADVGATESATKANGLLDLFQKGETLLGLMVASRPVALLEQLKCALQAKPANVSGMLEAVKISSESIWAWRSDGVFHEIFIAAEEKGEKYELDPLEIPRRRCPPKRFADEVPQNHPANPEEHYRKHYLDFIDAVSKGLSDRYNPSKSGVAQYLKLENMLTSGKVDFDVISQYPELDKCSPPMQLERFKQNYKSDTLHNARLAHRSMTPEVRSLFPQVLVLLKLLLVCPVSSASASAVFPH